MNVKELAEKLNKSPENVKRILKDHDVIARNITSLVDDVVANKILEKYIAPKSPKILRVIKKAALDKVEVVKTEENQEVSAGQRAIQMIADEAKKKEEPPKPVEVEEAPKKEEHAETPREHALAEDGIIRSAEVSIAPPLVNPLKVDIHSKKEKEKIVQHEKTFYKDKDKRDGNIQNILQQRPKKSKSKYKKMRMREQEEEQVEVVETAEVPTEIVLKEEYTTIQNLAKLANKTPMELITLLLKAKILITINQKLDIAMASKVGEIIGIPVRADFSEKEDSKIKYDLHMLEATEVEDTTENLQVRAPIVTIMGHVDHGKTKLLDTIRSSRIVEGEAGGITQHIGAYQVEYNGKKITFLDTPGHAAFTTLRARGAQVTDIVILVVAANDGIMPQTVEAIDHAKAAGVPIIIAVNKVDLPEANIERVKQQLTQYELVPEEWGGKTVCCEISAKQKIGIDHLLEMVLLTAEVEALKANPNKKAQGIIIESKLSKERGPVATVLIKAGTLRKGDPYVIGTAFGRVRAMFNASGKEVFEAPPACPIELIGISEVPRSGEIFQVVGSDKEARAIADQRATDEKAASSKKTKLTLTSLSKGFGESKQKNLNIVIKADVQGSLEALTSSIIKLNSEAVHINIIHSGTGIVNESDIMLAKASEAVILTFTVGVQSEAENLAAKEEVEIRKYNIIYKLLEDLELAAAGLLEPEYEEVVIGKAEVRSIFKSSKTGNIAGSFVTEGLMRRTADKVQVIRKNKVICEDKFSSLKRFKDDAKEVQTGFEFGFTLDKFDAFEVGDSITVIETREKPRDRNALKS